MNQRPPFTFDEAGNAYDATDGTLAFTAQELEASHERLVTQGIFAQAMDALDAGDEALCDALLASIGVTDIDE